MEADMTDAERLAMMSRIIERQVEQIEREQTRPAWHHAALGFAVVFGVMAVMTGATLIVKHLV